MEAARPFDTTPCAACGTTGGAVVRGRTYPDRLSGNRFGIDGRICRTCYSARDNQARFPKRQPKKHSTQPVPAMASTLATDNPDPMTAQGWVYKVALEYAGRGLSFEDLVSEGQVGLMIACRKFEPGRGTKLLTYADDWIRQSIRRAIDNQSRTIRIPVCALEKARKEGRAVPPGSPKVIGDHTFEHGTLGRVVADYRGGDPDAVFAKDDLAALMRCLTPREADVIRMRCGIGQDAMGFKEIAAHFGITRQAIEWIVKGAITKLRAAAGVEEGVAA